MAPESAIFCIATVFVLFAGSYSQDPPIRSYNDRPERWAREPFPEECPENETYEACVSSSCGERRCGAPKQNFCTLDCGYGCFCLSGYFRVEKGGCVREKDCPKKAIIIANRCYLPPKIGLCFARFTRYYYDHTTLKCKRFIYGGCHGNKNNFRTIEECEKVCK